MRNFFLGGFILFVAAVAHADELSSFTPAQLSKVKSDFEKVDRMYKEFKLEHSRWPTTKEELEMERLLPKDPWGEPYYVDTTPKYNRFLDIRTFGADKWILGTGENRDIGNWELTD